MQRAVELQSDMPSLPFLDPKLVCEEVNVDRFFPALYPKVRFAFARLAADAVYALYNLTLSLPFYFSGLKTYCDL